MEDKPRNSTSTLRWFAQAVLGVLLIVLLSVHLLVNHWVAPQGLLSQADVVRYYNVPGIALMETVFLFIVTAHCLLGLHCILLDLYLSLNLTSALTWLLIILGISVVIYGTRLIWVVTFMLPA
jgi:succinate dehydrogenase hydrophobic anchor subunit